MLGRESSFPSGLEGKIVFLCGGFGRVGDEEVWEDREGEDDFRFWVHK